jgi:hypothetical protein
VKGLEPSTYRVTGDRSNQLSYTPTVKIMKSYTTQSLKVNCNTW